MPYFLRVENVIIISTYSTLLYSIIYLDVFLDSECSKASGLNDNVVKTFGLSSHVLSLVITAQIDM